MTKVPDAEPATQYVLTLESWNELKAADRTAGLAILAEGGAVNVRTAARELPRARAVVTVRRDGEIVGLGAIKGERLEYAAEKAAQSGFDFAADTLELGYVAVEKGHRNRGLSNRIVGDLLAEYNGRLFATTDDPHMKRTLTRASFLQRGEEWKGRRGQVSLWIRECGIRDAAVLLSRLQ